MARLYLHIGMHKTGTSSIQAAFTACRDRLPGLGLAYVDSSSNRNAVLQAAFGRTEAEFAARGAAGAKAEADLVAVLTAARAPTVLISGETMTNFRGARLAALGDLATRLFDDVRVVVYVRDPMAWASSQAQQHVKHGRVTLAELVADPAGPAGRRGRSIVPRYREAIGGYIDLFGRDRVDIRLFDAGAFVDGDLIADFCHAIGAPGLAATLPRPQVNVALSHEAVLLLDAHTEWLRQSGQGRDQQETDAFRARIRQIPGARFTLPAETLLRIRTAVADDVAWLEAQTGRALFADRPPPPAPPTAWSPETVRQMVAAFAAPGPRRTLADRWRTAAAPIVSLFGRGRRGTTVR